MKRKWDHREVSPHASCWPEKKIKLWEMENFVLILEVCKFSWCMNHVSRKRPSLCGEGDRKEICWERSGTKLYGSSHTRSCIEATNLPLQVVSTKIYCWGSRKQQWMGLIVEDSIKEELLMEYAHLETE